ncbi:MAG: heavy metal translocating P-type ATPase [Phascolarctobacterium sp.]
MKELIRDLEEVRNSSREVRSFRHVHGHIKGNEDYSNHPEGCTCGHCGKDHDHSSMGHVPAHSHGDGVVHSHEHGHEHHHHHDQDDCCCGNDHHDEHHGHEEECGCGSDHHEQEDECDCSHGHEDECGCDHEHGTRRKRRGPQIGCGCCGDEEEDEHGHDHEHGDHVLWELVLGGIVFIVTEWLGLIPDAYHIYCLLFAYVVLGWRIVLTAVKNIFKGNVFDENFLMTVATLGAFAIKAWEEAVGVIFFYRLGEYFEERAVEKSRGQIMDAVDMRPEVVNLLVGGEVKVIPAENAKVGDMLLVRAGDRIPLDGVVVEGESLVDTSPVTGEPVPVKRKVGDEIISGCVNTSGMLKIRVQKVLAESMVTRILDSVENAAASKPTIDRFITRFARVYTPFVVAAAIATAVLPSLITGDWQKWVYTALTFLVISCPCALVLSVPLAFFSGIGAGSKYGILFKGGVAMEALKNVAAVVMDKTGTVTKGNFVLQKVQAAQGFSDEELLQCTASAELVSTHPIALSIVTAAKERSFSLVRPDSFEEIAGEGLVAYFGQQRVLCGNAKLMQRYNIACKNYAPTLAGSEVLVAKDDKYMGQLLINDTLKEDAKGAIAALKKQGLVTAMLTGDAEQEAAAVAAAAGIDEVRSQLLPQDKLRELGELRKKYGAVMFVGDGINDAPVLAGADVGAAMGSGADAAIEAADVVFMNSEVKAIPQAIAIARATGNIAWQNVVFALAVKVIIMVAGLMGYASMWAAVFADTGVSVLCVLNSVRILYKKV